MIFKLDDNVKFVSMDGKAGTGRVTGLNEETNTVGIVTPEYRYVTIAAEDVVLDYDSKKELLNTNAAEPNYHDSHYMELGVQPIDVIEQFPTEQRIGFYRGNAIKYLMRLGHKDNGLKEAEKASRYCNWLVKALKGEEVDPRE